VPRVDSCPGSRNLVAVHPVPSYAWVARARTMETHRCQRVCSFSMRCWPASSGACRHACRRFTPPRRTSPAPTDTPTRTTRSSSWRTTTSSWNWRTEHCEGGTTVPATTSTVGGRVTSQASSSPICKSWQSRATPSGSPSASLRGSIEDGPSRAGCDRATQRCWRCPIGGNDWGTDRGPMFGQIDPDSVVLAMERENRVFYRVDTP
jgi:hypothetical protein